MAFLAALSPIFAAFFAFFVYSHWHQRKHNPKGLSLPVGPSPRLLVGNLRDLPRQGYEWVAYKALSKKHGSDVVFLRVLGKPILVINSLLAANDLLSKKGAIYSDRPRLPMLKELMGWDWNLVVMSYHEGFSEHRRIIQQKFQQQVVEKSYRPVIRREIRAMLERILDKPEDYTHHLKSMTGAIIMMVTYGHQVNPEGDEYVQLAEDVFKSTERSPGAAVPRVDIFPIFKHIPTWFPGAAFKRRAIMKNKLAKRMREAPYQMVQKRMDAGTAVPCVVSELIEEQYTADGQYDVEIIKNCGGVVYSAGADTTTTAVQNFLLAMMLHPAVQHKAQSELDKVIGRDRLPDFEDRPQLPYLDCVFKENLRWKVVTPLGVPHCNTVDDEYRGRHIPQASTVISNIWAMLHDESLYNLPEDFNPDRYTSPDGISCDPDPKAAAFGFGRRVCPGRFLAEDSIWLAMASLLHTFTISKPVDADAELSSIQWSSGLVSRPSPFPCLFSPRFQGAAHLMRSQ